MQVKLEKLGVSPYEAKAYLGLLQKRPANGYEISKLTRIPAAKVYETTHRRLKRQRIDPGPPYSAGGTVLFEIETRDTP